MFTICDCFHVPLLSDTVFRLKPVLDEHVKLIKELAKNIQVPCWLLSHTTAHTLNCCSHSRQG